MKKYQELLVSRIVHGGNDIIVFITIAISIAIAVDIAIAKRQNEEKL